MQFDSTFYKYKKLLIRFPFLASQKYILQAFT